jgi:hypothetical protein
MASTALVLAAFGQTTFAQSSATGFPATGNASLLTTVPAIPELSPSISEAEAIFKLASRLEVGDATVARDDVLARRLYRIAADSGHAGAQCNLGAMLMDGTGGPTDLAGGAALFRKAALRGHGLAQYNLGVMHALGDGVVKDAGEAMAWIEQAITRLPEGEAMASAKAWREHLRNRMSAREGLIARSRSQELGEAVVRELAAASTGSASRAARSAVRSGLDELGLSPEALQRFGLAPTGAALVGNAGSAAGVGAVGSTATVTAAVEHSKVVASSRAKSASKSPVSRSAVLANVADEVTQGPTVSVETALQEWLRAWSDRRVDDYLGFYDPSYTPLGGTDRAGWAKRRRAAIRRPDWVKVHADQISTTEMSPEEVVVGFVQRYSASTGHRETTRKSMIWRWTDGRWQIVSEQSLTVPGEADREEAEKAQLESQREAQAAEIKAQREAQAAALRAQRIEQAAAIKAQQEAQATSIKAQLEAERAAAKVAREAAAIAARAKRDEALAAAKAARETELANIREELASKQAAAKNARESQLSAERAARDAESAAIQAKREAELAAENARKEEKRVARKALSGLPKSAPIDPSAPGLVADAPSASGGVVATPAPSAVHPAMEAVTTPKLPTAPITSAFEPAVRAWVKAWADRQVDTYLAFYAPGFELPAGQDRVVWAAERRESMTRPAWIKVRTDQLKTSVEGDKAQARFFQVYVVAPGTVELTQKTMRWIWFDGRWQILQEQSEPMARKHSGR